MKKENFREIKKAKLPFQERFEAIHKLIRKYRKNRARHEDKKSKYDIMHNLTLDSDPETRSFYPEVAGTKVPETATNEDEEIILSMFDDQIILICY